MGLLRHGLGQRQACSRQVAQTLPHLRLGATGHKLVGPASRSPQHGFATHTPSIVCQATMVAAPPKAPTRTLVPTGFDNSNTSLAQPADSVVYKFVVPQYVTKFGQSLRVVGDLPVLGAWDVHKAPNMKWQEGHKWFLELDLPRVNFEFKVVVVEAEQLRWEQGVNRVVQAEVKHNEPAVPVELVIQVQCAFGLTRETGMDLVLDKANVQESYELANATLALLEQRRSRVAKALQEAATQAADHQVEASRLSAAMAQQRGTIEDIRVLLETGRTSADGAHLLLRMPKGHVVIPREIRSLARSRTGTARNNALPAPATATSAASQQLPAATSAAATNTNSSSSTAGAANGYSSRSPSPAPIAANNVVTSGALPVMTKGASKWRNLANNDTRHSPSPSPSDISPPSSSWQGAAGASWRGPQDSASYTTAQQLSNGATMYTTHTPGGGWRTPTHGVQPQQVMPAQPSNPAGPVLEGDAIFFSETILTSSDEDSSDEARSPSPALNTHTGAGGSSKAGGGVGGALAGANSAVMTQLNRLAQLSTAITESLQILSKTSDTQQALRHWQQLECMVVQAQAVQERLMAEYGGPTPTQLEELDQLKSLIKFAQQKLTGMDSAPLPVGAH